MMARPTKSPKGNRESFRLSDKDVEKLKLCVEKTRMSKTDVIRMGIDKIYMELKEK